MNIPENRLQFRLNDGEKYKWQKFLKNIQKTKMSIHL